MTLAQIDHFIGEMYENNAYFGRIRILGGEPTIHPKFADIVTRLYNGLVLKRHVGFIEVVTNGEHSERIMPVNSFISRVRFSKKRAKQKNHIANLLHTPMSLGYRGIRCGMPEYCGWSLSYYGWAPCSAGAGIMRLWDMIPSHQRLTMPHVRKTEDNWPELKKLCDRCQHGLREEDKVHCGMGNKDGQSELNTPHPEVWSQLAPWLSGKQPDWKVYGQ